MFIWLFWFLPEIKSKRWNTCGAFVSFDRLLRALVIFARNSRIHVMAATLSTLQTLWVKLNWRELQKQMNGSWSKKFKNTFAITLLILPVYSVSTFPPNLIQSILTNKCFPILLIHGILLPWDGVPKGCAVSCWVWRKSVQFDGKKGAMFADDYHKRLMYILMRNTDIL